MPVENIYDIGDDPLVGYTLRNASGALADASVVAYSLDSAGASTGLSPTRISLGQYQAVFAPATVGRWFVTFAATGAQRDSETVSLIFRDPLPARPDDAYATVDDVIRNAKGRTFTASSPVTVSEVQDFLNFSAGEINGLLRRGGYDLPVATTATSALALLAHGNALGAACLVESAAPIPNRSSQVCKLYADFKKMILAGDLELDAGRDESSSSPRSNAANQATALFTREPWTAGRDW